MDKKTDATPDEKPSKDRDLLILGILAVGIAIATTVISLVIYHKSGDIYLDRSRPGFLPDEEEIQQQPETNYSFPSSGVLTGKDLDEYIKHFEETVDTIDDLASPFSESSLSDEAFGIPEKPAEPESPEAPAGPPEFR